VSGKSVLIRKVFPLADSSRLLVHLGSYQWDFSTYGPVAIALGRARLRCRYVACGNQSGEPVLELCLEDPRYSSVGEVDGLLRSFEGPLYLVRDEERDEIGDTA